MDTFVQFIAPLPAAGETVHLAELVTQSGEVQTLVGVFSTVDKALDACRADVQRTDYPYPVNPRITPIVVDAR